MLIMKILAAGFAILVLAKIIMLVVARDYWLGLVDKMYGPGNRTLMIYGIASVGGGRFGAAAPEYYRSGGGDAVDLPADGAGDDSLWRDAPEMAG